MEQEFVWFAVLVLGFGFGLIIYLVQQKERERERKYAEEKEKIYIEERGRERKYAEEKEKIYIEERGRERKYAEEKEKKFMEEFARKDVLMQKMLKKMDEHTKDKDIKNDQILNLEKETLHLRKSLEDIQRDYLYTTKKLSARGVLEAFQKRHVFKNRDKKQIPPRKMWEEFLKEEKGKAFQAKMDKENCGDVVEIATSVYGKLSNDIHNHFHEGIRKVYLVKSELSHCDYIFLKNVCLSLPLSPSDIVTLDTKSEFVFSP